jgi:hypothetical protein
MSAVSSKNNNNNNDNDDNDSTSSINILEGMCPMISIKGGMEITCIELEE